MGRDGRGIEGEARQERRRSPRTPGAGAIDY